MPTRSFISSFKSLSPASRASVALIAGCLLIAATAEAVVRIGFDTVSRIQRRTALEYQTATGQPALAPQHTALFVGNSLLDEGLRFDVIQTRLAPEWDARRFVVEQTFYYDWYYGLRRLFADGARPDVVVIVLSPPQWIRDDMRGDYSAYYLMTAADAARRALHMHPTAGTGFVLASLSNFWSARAEIRNFVLGRILPDFGELMSATAIVDRTAIVEDEIERIATARFEQCRELADAYGVRLIALVPPLLNSIDGARGLARAGRKADLTVFAPVQSGTYPASFYRDAGFHLNPSGAEQFSREIAEPLHALLDHTVNEGF